MFSCFLVYLHANHRVLFRQLPDHLYQSRQILRALRFHRDRDNRLTVMLHTFEWNYLRGRKRRTHYRIFQTYERNYVTRRYLSHFYTLLALEYSYLLYSVLFIHARYEYFRAFFHGSAKKSPGSHFPCMGVHGDAGYHKSDITRPITACHAFSYPALGISLPYHGNSILLCLYGIWQMFCYHIKNCFIRGAFQR